MIPSIGVRPASVRPGPLYLPPLPPWCGCPGRDPAPRRGPGDESPGYSFVVRHHLLCSLLRSGAGYDFFASPATWMFSRFLFALSLFVYSLPHSLSAFAPFLPSYLLVYSLHCLSLYCFFAFLLPVSFSRISAPSIAKGDLKVLTKTLSFDKIVLPFGKVA